MTSAVVIRSRLAGPGIATAEKLKREKRIAQRIHVYTHARNTPEEKSVAGETAVPTRFSLDMLIPSEISPSLTYIGSTHTYMYITRTQAKVRWVYICIYGGGRNTCAWHARNIFSRRTFRRTSAARCI